MADTFPDLLQKKLADALAATSVAGDLPTDFSAEIAQSQNPQFGDYQSNAAMVLSKRVGKNPRELATEIVEKFDGGDLCAAPGNRGPRFYQFQNF